MEHKQDRGVCEVYIFGAYTGWRYVGWIYAAYYTG